MKIFKCRICGNVVMLLENGGGELVCCGQPMEELIAKENNEGMEKHIPVIKVDGSHVTVEVGSIAHPMIETHYITKIFAVYNGKTLTLSLQPNQEPKVEFDIIESFNTLEIYEHCNIHDLWKATYIK